VAELEKALDVEGLVAEAVEGIEVLTIGNQTDAIHAVNRMQKVASESGASRLSLDEINAEIAAARKEVKED